MYDKLGDLLNDVLESGRIPEAKQEDKQDNNVKNDRNSSNIQKDDSGHFSFNQNNVKNNVKIPKKEENQTAEVIRMHKYTKIMHIPPEIQQALTTLDIAYPYNTIQLNKQYHKILKLHHPDKKNTIQNSDNVKNIRQLTIDEIKAAYYTLIEYLNKQK